MTSELKTLLAVRNADLEVLALQKRLNDLRSDIHDRQATIVELRQTIETTETAIQNLESRRRLKELEVAQFSTEVESLQKQVKEARNNKEFAAFSTEIRQRTQSGKAVEDMILEFLEAIEAEQAKKSGCETAIREAEAACAQLEKDIGEQVSDIEKGIAGFRKERGILITNLPEKLAEEYERLFERFAGEAVCVLEDAACSGCWMTLASGDVGRLIREPVIICPSCGRLLHRPQTS